VKNGNGNLKLQQPEYVAGVTETKKDWSKNTLEAGANYEAGVTAAIADKRFQGGSCQSRNSEIGVTTLSRKGPTTAGRRELPTQPTRTKKGFAPYRAAISNLQLPPTWSKRFTSEYPESCCYSSNSPRNQISTKEVDCAKRLQRKNVQRASK